ncbi:MAG: two-component sensor histidine kinase [Azospira oryzae]|nr:two-component sensor histidine kinase [Cytophaga sp.]PZR38862.1 MAG: two-component sensor histidine kinase [Azospira oryzae]
MSRSTLRIVIILAAISIAGITATQIYWVRRALEVRENQFYRDVNASLRNVAQKIFEINRTPSSANNPVNQLSSNYFTVMINGPIDASLLEFLLKTEFEKRNVTSEFEYGIYDCSEKCMVGGNYISPKKGKTVAFPQAIQLKNDGYYFAVVFPGIEANLISQMGIWGFSSAVLLVVIFFFIYTLLVILKQRRLSEVQKDFINNMTHEFKTPISTIAISAEVLKTPGIVQTPERLLNYVTIIQNENNRLKQQVERVLQMARLDKEDIGLKREQLDIHELICEAVKNITPSLQSKNGKINLDLNAMQNRVSVDRLHFTNVFYNLLDNAIKYNPSAPEIVISTRADNKMLQISVSDNGIGIKEENHKKVFHKFYRVPTGNIHDVKGFGIGLNYVKLIVEKHEGKVSLRSNIDKGCTFTIEIPYID